MSFAEPLKTGLSQLAHVLVSTSKMNDVMAGQSVSQPLKVTGDSWLIHEFTYSLFIGLFSVTCNMTGYSHSFPFDKTHSLWCTSKRCTE